MAETQRHQFNDCSVSANIPEVSGEADTTIIFDIDPLALPQDVTGEIGLHQEQRDQQHFDAVNSWLDMPDLSSP